MVRWWSLAFAIALAMLLMFFLVTSANIQVLTDPTQAMSGARPIAAIVGVSLLIADVFLPVPSSLVMVAHGALFGVVGGSILSLIGSVASALTGFAVGRAGNGWIRRVVTDREHARASAMLERWGVVAIALSRPVPILAETVAILAGSSAVTWPQATLAATAGSIIPAVVYAWAGAHAQRFASTTMIFLGVMAVTGLLMLVSKRLAPLMILAFCISLHADQTPRFDSVITVERDAIPRDEATAAVTVVDREQIQRLPATSLSSLLSYVPGITMLFDSGASGVPMITSRGFFGGGEVEYVKLLVNGVPVGDAESGNVDWRAFRASPIERIEILHDPGSALYGDAALGGVVQIYTRDLSTDRGELTLTGGRFSTRELDAAYFANLGAVRLTLHGGLADTNGSRAHSDTSDRSLQLSLVRNADRSRWRFDAAGTRKDRQEPGPLTREEIEENRAQSNALFRFDRDETDRKRVSATYESFGTNELLATVHAAGRDGDTLRTLLLAPGFGVAAVRALSTRTYGTTLEAARNFDRGMIRGGVDLDRASLDGRYASVGDEGETLDVAASQRGHRDRAGLFVTGAWNVCARCRLSAGLRRDEIRDDFGSASRDASAWSPRAGFNVRTSGGTSFFVQISRAFKAPTLDQLFDPRPYPDGTGGTFTISNPTLRPQRARNFEAGVTRSGATTDYSLVAYRMRVTDEIDFDPQTYSYRNIGSSLHRGVEAGVTFARTSMLSPRITYAWTRVADSSTPDLQLKNIPEHVAQLLLHAQLPKETSIDAVYRWMHGRTLDDEGLFAMPDVSRVDVRIAKDLARVRLQLDVLNALDAHYNEVGFVLFGTAFEFPAPGRTLRAGATWRF